MSQFLSHLSVVFNTVAYFSFLLSCNAPVVHESVLSSLTAHSLSVCYPTALALKCSSALEFGTGSFLNVLLSCRSTYPNGFLFHLNADNSQISFSLRASDHSPSDLADFSLYECLTGSQVKLMPLIFFSQNQILSQSPASLFISFPSTPLVI